MYVKIFKLGEEQQEITTFSEGTHVLGRGPSLQCNDKRVSRNHATLEVTEDSVKLTSTHVNPCFLKAANSKTITILVKDSTSELKDGASFALLPDDFWFKIKLGFKEEVPNGVETKVEKGEGTNKRFSCSYSEDAPPDKKPKLESNENDASEIPSSSSSREENGECHITEDNLRTSQSTKKKVLENDGNGQPETTNNTNDLDTTEAPTEEKIDETEDHETTNDLEATDVPTEEKINEIQDLENTNDLEASNVPTEENIDETHDQENVASTTNNVAQNDDAPNKKDEDSPPLDGATAANPGPPQPKLQREKCWYGAECYRKNPTHRQDYTHPGDSDFESDTDDNRPSCSYGAKCYRKNKLHRQQYKHPPRERPGKKKRSRKKVDRLNAANSQDVRDFYDEFSESEDPFIDDDDSDEYTGESEGFEDTPETDDDD